MVRTRPNYFGAWAKHKRTIARIEGALNAGACVIIATYTKATIYDRRHAGMFRADARGAWVRRGRSWDDVSGCAIVVSAR